MGWFDFLKKNKKPQAEDAEKAPASTADVDQADRTKSALNLNAGTEAIMQKEAILLQIMDGLYDNPMKFLMQKRAKIEILKHLNAFLDSRPAAKDFWSKEGKEIIPAVTSLLDDADKFAAEKGMKSSPQRQSLIVNIVMLGGIVALFAIPGVMAALGSFYLVIMCAICFIPQLTQKFLNTRFAKFQAAHGAEFAKTVTSRLEILHDMVQYLLTDIRETLIENGNDLSNIRFQLWNSDYKDIKVLDSKMIPGMAKTIYVVRFVKDDEDEDEDEAGPVIPTSSGPNSDVDFETDPNNAGAGSEDDGGDEDEADVDTSEPEKKYP